MTEGLSGKNLQMKTCSTVEVSDIEENFLTKSVAYVYDISVMLLSTQIFLNTLNLKGIRKLCGFNMLVLSYWGSANHAQDQQRMLSFCSYLVEFDKLQSLNAGHVRIVC